MGLSTHYDEFENYREYLRGAQDTKKQDINDAVNSLVENLKESVNYQPDAEINGIKTEIVAIRKDTNKCSVTVLPGDNLNIGDEVYIFNEHWICMEIYMDEYGIKYGEIWMCNQVFNYQNHKNQIIHKYAIVDDGSYAKGADKPIIVLDNTYICYISLDKETECLFIDKRLAIDTLINSKGESVLEVGKISSIDKTTRNFGIGSHLLVFRLKSDVFNPSVDNVELLICDFNNLNSSIEQTDGSKYLTISGKNSIAVGTTRKYTANLIDINGNTVNPENVSWDVTALSGVSIIKNGNVCSLKISLNDNLVGKTITLSCSSVDETILPANKEVVVISIG